MVFTDAFCLVVRENNYHFIRRYGRFPYGRVIHIGLTGFDIAACLSLTVSTNKTHGKGTVLFKQF